MNIVYLHGWLSSPNSNKRRELQKAGHHVYAPMLPKDDWGKSLSIAAEMISRVPVADSVHLSNSLAGAKFIEVGACHRMNDAPAISAMLGALPVQS
jgi:predicted esterase YcpF (UPF0227 family)